MERKKVEEKKSRLWWDVEFWQEKMKMNELLRQAKKTQKKQKDWKSTGLKKSLQEIDKKKKKRRRKELKINRRRQNWKKVLGNGNEKVVSRYSGYKHRKMEGALIKRHGRKKRRRRRGKNRRRRRGKNRRRRRGKNRRKRRGKNRRREEYLM